MDRSIAEEVTEPCRTQGAHCAVRQRNQAAAEAGCKDTHCQERSEAKDQLSRGTLQVQGQCFLQGLH